MNTTVGIIGLGRMGSAIAYRLIQAQFSVIGFDFNVQACQQAQDFGVEIAPSIAACAQRVSVLWLMVPAGDTVDAVLRECALLLPTNAIIVDGGNSNFMDSQRRARDLATMGIMFIDCGTSGGVHGKELGFSLMVGGDKVAYNRIVPYLQAIAAPDGFGYVGSSGAGHYVKMVHNGIEYAVLQAYAEGLHVIKDGSFKNEKLDLPTITHIWNNGSVIRSWLLQLLQPIVRDEQEIERISGSIAESGTGQWTVQEAHKHKIPVTLIEDALTIRAQSRSTGGNYATKLVALLRRAFGGHAVSKV